MGKSIVLKGEASPALEMSDGPMDRSDPSDKQSYGRTFILPMVKSRNSIDVGSIVLRRQGACQHWKCQMVRWIDRIHRKSHLTVGHLFYRWRNDVIIQRGKV